MASKLKEMIGKVTEIKDEAHWHEVLKAADSTPVVVDFTATWCGPCKMISPVFEEMSATFTDVIFVKVDVDKVEKVAAAAGISAMPTFQVYKYGEKIDELVGASKDRLAALVGTLSTKGEPALA